MRHKRAHVCVRARGRACGRGRARIRAANVRALSVSEDRLWLGSQAFAWTTSFNADIGAWNTALIAKMEGVCPLCQRLSVRRVCLGVACGAAFPVCRRPRPMEPAATHASAVLLSSFRASLISRVYLAYSVVSKLFEGAWSGAKAFYGATVFNANIGAWNTASMTTMASVCPHCHRLRVGRVWLGLAWHAALRGLYAVGRGLYRASADRGRGHACLFASLISRELYVHQ